MDRTVAVSVLVAGEPTSCSSSEGIEGVLLLRWLGVGRGPAGHGEADGGEDGEERAGEAGNLLRVVGLVDVVREAQGESERCLVGRRNLVGVGGGLEDALLNGTRLLAKNGIRGGRDLYRFGCVR